MLELESESEGISFWIFLFIVIGFLLFIYEQCQCGDGFFSPQDPMMTAQDLDCLICRLIIVPTGHRYRALL